MSELTYNFVKTHFPDLHTQIQTLKRLKQQETQLQDSTQKLLKHGEIIALKNKLKKDIGSLRLGSFSTASTKEGA